MFEKLSFRSRRIVHYSLIVCILLLQFVIAGFFYNEFVSKKNLKFLKGQLEEIHSLENLADESKKHLLNAQVDFGKYILSNDRKFLKSYFGSINKLDENLDRIGKYGNKYPRLKKVEIAGSNPKEFITLKSLIDSSYEYSTKANLRTKNDFPVLKKYKPEYHFGKFDIETKTYSDTVKKKGFFGRLGDAISGRENVRKESTIITVKHGKIPDTATIKAEFDSILNVVNNHYTGEIKKIKVKVIQKQNAKAESYEIFSNLLTYGNSILNMYEYAIKNSRTDLEKEYYRQNSTNNRIRMNIIFGAIILMAAMSVLIMLLTRIAFSYENKLKTANVQIISNLEFKNRILGMFSHELRSPLKIMRILISRINEKTNDEEIREYLKSFDFTSNTLLIQSNQILEYAKNQHAKNKLIPVRFNLSHHIISILNSIETYIKTRNNELVVQTDIDPGLVVFSDNAKINQIFMNILGNANKFTERGKISVMITTETVNTETVSLITRVSDTGVGIKESDLRKIFEPYYQGVLSEDIENIGAGLGLSLCKELVELYDGKISVESEAGKGTTVNFSLNLKINNDE